MGVYRFCNIIYGFEISPELIKLISKKGYLWIDTPVVDKKYIKGNYISDINISANSFPTINNIYQKFSKYQWERNSEPVIQIDKIKNLIEGFDQNVKDVIMASVNATKMKSKRIVEDFDEDILKPSVIEVIEVVFCSTFKEICGQYMTYNDIMKYVAENKEPYRFVYENAIDEFICQEEYSGHIILSETEAKNLLLSEYEKLCVISEEYAKVIKNIIDIAAKNNIEVDCTPKLIMYNGNWCTL
jgi:hypothetical protein